MKYDYKKIREAYLLLLHYEFSCMYDVDLSEEQLNYLYENIVLGGEGSCLINEIDLKACRDELKDRGILDKESDF